MNGAAGAAANDRVASVDQPLSALKLWVMTLCAVLAFIGLSALGVWQLERRVWKLALIERVEQRVHAAPTLAPGPAEWPAINARDAEYRHVFLTGHFLNDRETLVHSVTDLGSGYWVMTPLQTDVGFTVLINRGFVPPERREPATRMAGQIERQVTVTGLLRMSEPKGAFLHNNDSQSNRWYSRDVVAIATARELAQQATAPYFIDADAPSTDQGAMTAEFPVAGLTVISFHNNHLSYAITWFALAVMPAAFILITISRERRLRRRNIHRTYLKT